MAESLMEMGSTEVALTYVNNDYGKGLATSFEEAFKSLGGTITISAAHEDEKADYSAEVAALAAAGGDRLVVAGYNTGGGAGIIRASLDSGAFDMFHLPDGMIGGSLETDFGSEIDGTTGQAPGTDSPGASQLVDLIGDAFDGSSVFVAESYDAAALIMLAMQAAGSDNPADYKGKVMDVANAPGEKIYPGELAKGLEILANGGDIDYVGASAVELIGPGESSGSYRQIVFEGGKMTTVKYR